MNVTFDVEAAIQSNVGWNISIEIILELKSTSQLREFSHRNPIQLGKCLFGIFVPSSLTSMTSALVLFSSPTLLIFGLTTQKSAQLLSVRNLAGKAFVWYFCSFHLLLSDQINIFLYFFEIASVKEPSRLNEKV